MTKVIFTAVLLVSGIAFADNHGTAAHPAPGTPAAKVEKAAKKVETTTTETAQKAGEAATQAETTTTTTTNKVKAAGKDAKAKAKAAVESNEPVKH